MIEKLSKQREVAKANEIKHHSVEILSSAISAILHLLQTRTEANGSENS
jgi:hypothetical protein